MTHIIESPYFTEAEFHGAYHKMDKNLLLKLHDLREEIDQPLNLSNNCKGFSRTLGGYNRSQHNIDVWGKCRAADGYIPEDMSYQEFYEACRAVGFTGIGLYTGWSTRGFHVDVRPDRDANSPATWSGFYKDGGTQYKSIRELTNA